MKKYLSLVTILGLSTLNATEFHALGSSNIAMGGAGVASASGSLAGYYNPALLTQKEGVEVSLDLGVGIREKNLGEQINTISDLDLTDVVDRIAQKAPIGGNTESDKKNILSGQKALKDIGDENGISIMPTAHLGVQYDNMAVGLYLTNDIAIYAKVDKTHTDLIVKNDSNYYTYDAVTDAYNVSDKATYEASSLQYALDNKLTTAKVQGLSLTEIPISYAKAFELPMGELGVGTSVKFMHGTTYTETLDIDDDDATKEDHSKQNQKDSDNIGIDVGLLFKPSSVSQLKVGLVAKNLNAPSFDMANGGSIKEDTQVRTGAEYTINENLNIAADLDLTTNKTLINGYDSQMFGGGLNYHPLSWFALRGGLMQNLVNSNDGLIYTAGVALGLPKFNVDVSAQIGSNTGKYDGEDIPKYGKVNIALVSKW